MSQVNISIDELLLLQSMKKQVEGKVITNNGRTASDGRMKLNFTETALKYYVYWQTEDKKTLKRINHLLDDIQRNGFVGIGKPEPLKENLSGSWSRRIDDYHRLVYQIEGDVVTIRRCRGHYE